MLVDRDVPGAMRHGMVLGADVYRPGSSDREDVRLTNGIALATMPLENKQPFGFRYAF